MTEVHLPRLDDDEADATNAPVKSTTTPTPEAKVASPPVISHRKTGLSGFRLMLEVALIAMGVFLGLAGEQWRENARQRENAMGALRRLRSEVTTNRDAVGRVKDYHATTRRSLRAYLQQDAKTRTAN